MAEEEIKQVDINGRVYDLQDETARKDNVYSTTEIDTGKKWINGKPIYKITTEGTASFGNGYWTYITLFSDGIQRKIVKLDISCEGTCLRPQFLEITNTIAFSTPTSAGNGAGVNNAKYILTIEYTKAN